MIGLRNPSPSFIASYIARFDEGNDGLADKALSTLFSEFPKNTELAHVLLKVVALNTLYGTYIWQVIPVAENIWCQHIDEKLAQGDLDLVDEIAATPSPNGRMRRNYSFATKYCSWHQPNHYPIYDSYIDRLFWEYRRIDNFAKFRRQDLTDYRSYVRIVERFREFYKLDQFSFKDLDKALWQYGKECFGENNTVTNVSFSGEMVDAD